MAADTLTCAKLNDSTIVGATLRAIAVFLILSIVGAVRAAEPDPYAPLWLTKGAWRISQPNQAPYDLVNQCALAGKYFVCAQTTNGKAGSLLIFIPADKPGRYYTQSVTPEGRGTRRGDLEISGDRWIYTTTWDTGGKTIYYRTANVFTGKNRIHFEQAESTDNKEWVVKATGDETRTGKAAR
ncbi:MAG TPA: hypothetical protein VGL97_01565 [Bryobacteraceae bacterium]